MGTKTGFTAAWNMQLTGLEVVDGMFAVNKERVPACIAVFVVCNALAPSKTIFFII